jgi:hypothetical protein
MTTELTFTLRHVLNKTNQAGCPNRFIHECNLADGGGGSTVGIRNFNLRGIQVIKRVKIDWFEPVLNVHTPLPPLLPQFF